MATHNSKLPTLKNLVKSNKVHIIQVSALFLSISIGLLILCYKLYSHELYYLYANGLLVMYILTGIGGLWAINKKLEEKKIYNRVILICFMAVNEIAAGIFFSLLIYLIANPWECEASKQTSCLMTYGMYTLMIGGFMMLLFVSIIFVVVFFVFFSSVKKYKENSIQFDDIEEIV
ncbi:hypothetical protein SteCoe_9670 [Stentor coeruleus]|uniref:Uncharacterized protein n=1 Tax=Stentor coeruleus TaxID=5963 RepID=A0A1R2CHB8_9CILI|nr:hypothetical protein SteCoe_9670 [Stentor coeruleus]